MDSRGGASQVEWLVVALLSLGCMSALGGWMGGVRQRFVGGDDELVGAGAIASVALLENASAGSVEMDAAPAPSVALGTHAQCADVSLSVLGETLGLPVPSSASTFVLPGSGFVNGAALAFQRNATGGQVVGDMFGTTDANLRRYVWDQPASQTFAELAHVVRNGAPDAMSVASGVLMAMPGAMVAAPGRLWAARGSALDFLILDSLRTLQQQASDGWQGSKTLIAAARRNDCVAVGETLRVGANNAPEFAWTFSDSIPLAGAAVQFVRRGAGVPRMAALVRLIGKGVLPDGIRSAARSVVVPSTGSRVARALAASKAFCFTAETRVHTERGLIAIRDVTLGDRVATLDEASRGSTETGADWLRVELMMDDPRNVENAIHLTLLRAPHWVRTTGASEGRTIAIALDELGIDGEARVVSITPAPPVRKGSGHVVLGTIENRSAEVLRIHFARSNEVLEPTAGHKLFSTEHNTWVRADSLRVGDRLRSRNGEATIAAIERKPGTHRVYNLEVERVHRYLVGKVGVLAHNDCAALPPSGWGGDSALERAIRRWPRFMAPGADVPRRHQFALRELALRGSPTDFEWLDELNRSSSWWRADRELRRTHGRFLIRTLWERDPVQYGRTFGGLRPVLSSEIFPDPSEADVLYRLRREQPIPSAVLTAMNLDLADDARRSIIRADNLERQLSIIAALDVDQPPLKMRLRPVRRRIAQELGYEYRHLTEVGEQIRDVEIARTMVGARNQRLPWAPVSEESVALASWPHLVQIMEPDVTAGLALRPYDKEDMFRYLLAALADVEGDVTGEKSSLYRLGYAGANFVIDSRYRGLNPPAHDTRRFWLWVEGKETSNPTVHFYEDRPTLTRSSLPEEALLIPDFLESDESWIHTTRLLRETARLRAEYLP